MKKQSPQSDNSYYEYFLIVAEISAALWVHIFVFETTLRKFIHSCLTNEYGSKDWWYAPNFLTLENRRNIERMESRLRKKNKRISAENIISNLSLSFWIELLSKRYHQKVWNKLLKYFPVHPGRREEFHRKAREIRNLRNSIAHHGPIMRRNLIRDHEYLHELTATLDPDLADAVQKRSRVLDLLLNARLVGSGGGI